ncbi:SdrD B-like domain-containing protein [Aeoliella mucimassa]|uniref:Serine-aspartate repeat-containing protein D n=1 Tax=Aeoliella mucimassa TaxID=2527972 RepID=A0A518ARW5_9BACT|nr:SdrD B-like domain-containing protein [Aeoliella mucimassa]QDU57454.1 Serine-aspartate repeat-containing protein D precursor [Aeoliella mucimassa]
MGLIHHLFGRRHSSTGSTKHSRKKQQRGAVRGQIESLEPRQMLSADGVVPEVLLGSVYFEEATGDDSQPDVIQVTFVGGAEGTTLNQLTISGDKRLDGLTDGDIFFDTEDGGSGAFKAVGLSIVDATGITIDSVSVTDGGTDIVITFSGFEAGESLKFSVDVDELQFADPEGDSVNSLVEGAEFERSKLTGQFSAEGYVDLQLEATYWDAFDTNMATAESETGLDLGLPADAYSTVHDYSDRTAGAVVHEAQIPLATLSGWVYHDASDDGVFDPATEEGIGGVTLELLDAAGNGTGIYTTTSSEPGKVGYYEFLNLPAGTYGVREVQPDGWLDGKDTVGSHGGTAADESTGIADKITGVVLAYGDDGVQYNFGELLPGSISGRVTVSYDEACHFDQPQDVLEGVQIDLLDAAGNVLQTTYTDSEGRYSFTDLAPGEYQVREHQPTDFYDGGERIGTSGGTKSDIGDIYSLFSNILLGSNIDATQYDFCEHVGPSLSGWVYHDESNEGSFDRDTEVGIGGVVVELLDANGVPTGITTVTSTETGKVGYYEFTNLAPGTYGVREVQPTGWIDGIDTAGTHGGTAADETTGTVDRITGAVINFGDVAEEYNFGEVLPGSISGRVTVSYDEACHFDQPQDVLEGVQIDLLDAAGNVLQTTYTDSEGRYTFTDLAPGEYQVREHQPTDFYDGGERIGTSGGTKSDIGDIYSLFSNILLGSNIDATQYDFCEHVGPSLSGWVYHDESNEGNFDRDNEVGIGGVVVELLDANGVPTGITTVTSTETGKVGYYEFTNLAPGTYGVREVQPTGWIDGIDTAGTHGGTAADETTGTVDRITGAVINFGDVAEEYNFGEVLPGSISGRVTVSYDEACHFDQPQDVLEGVQIDLLDAAGNVLQTTYTDSEGRYTFTDLAPGEYQVREHQPTDFYDGGERIGTSGGTKSDIGDIYSLFSNILLGSNIDATQYDFCEHVGPSLSGWVYHDESNEGNFDRDNEVGIGGVVVELLDANGVPTGITTVTSTETGNVGYYEFTNLAPGTYGVREVQPTGWIDGIDTAGTHGGTAADETSGTVDRITGAVINFGDVAEEYNFGELLPGSISGHVYVDEDGDCIHEEGEGVIPGVRVDLLDENGNLLDYTYTDDNGAYSFTGLAPGAYTVFEHQPEDYFNGGYHIGTGGGSYFGVDRMGDIEVGSNEHHIEYDFCEVPPATISGFVYIDGAPILVVGELPDNLADLRDGQRTADDQPLSGVTLELRHGYSGDPIFGSETLGGYYGDGPIRVVTDAYGYYEFSGLPAGTYAVVEVQPDGVIDHIDTEGSLGGLVVNVAGGSSNPVLEKTAEQQAAIEQMRVMFGTDVIFRIAVGAGQHSQENNFSEITTTSIWIPPVDPPVEPPSLITPPPTFAQTQPLFPLVAPKKVAPEIYGGGSRVVGYTWHLSLLDGGFPRSTMAAEELMSQTTSVQFSMAGWQQVELDQGTWTLSANDNRDDGIDELATLVVFGHPRGVPVVGDWDGDGNDEIGIFIDGKWYFDLNDNGRWDSGDLMAELGDAQDLPTAGDFDGDGKTDIAIFGPVWAGDPWAIEHEPGLPDAENNPGPLAPKAKNVPPRVDEATLGRRLLQHSNEGQVRADLIDHVFHYGVVGDQPVVGDWNGDGIATIGVFRGGVWNLDLNGDGRFTSVDAAVTFGGDGTPVVGDWNGDGIDDLGVFNDGRWTIDSNGNREMDAVDRVFELGAAGDVPVAGDWDGDGTDQPGVYTPGKSAEVLDEAA